jgi:prolyl 4-hydroxylase
MAVAVVFLHYLTPVLTPHLSHHPLIFSCLVCCYNHINNHRSYLLQNYTDIGFKKIRAPEALFKLLLDFWNNNRDQEVFENWTKGKTFTNHWDSPSSMITIQNSSLVGGGLDLSQQIWDATYPVISVWVGQELKHTSLYGIRVYKTNSILTTHVDRLPLVSSAIIHVAQDLDEPWPLEVYGHDGKATNVTMEPGDMVLYESHSVLHGRPFPLKGRFMANVFIHFEPTGPLAKQTKGSAKVEQLMAPGTEAEL